MVKKKVLELKNRKIIPPRSLCEKIKIYEKKIDEFKYLHELFKSNQEIKIEFNNELLNIQNKIFSAKVISHSTWNEFNEVRFRLINSDTALIYRTKEKEMIRELSLKMFENGECRIVSSWG